MRRLSRTIEAAIVVALITGACGTDVSSPPVAVTPDNRNSVTAPPPDFLTPVISTPMPDTRLTPGAPTLIVAPPERKTVVAPSATPVVTIDIIKAGKYDNQTRGLQEGWVPYWAPNGLINKDSVIIGFVCDQNNRCLAAIDAGDYWIFPPVVNGKPVYDGAPTPGTLLKPNYDTFRAYKIITEDIALKQGYSLEMAKLLDGSAFELRGGQMTRIKGGEIIAYLDRATSRWVPERSWGICATKAESKSCPITVEDAKNGEFLRFAARHDTSGPFDMSKVVFIPLLIDNPGKISYVRWQSSESIPDPAAFYASDLAKRTSRRMGWASLSDLNNTGVKAVKFVNPDGSIVYVLEVTQVTDDTNVDDNPLVTDTRGGDWISSAVEAALREWVASGPTPTMPSSLDGELLLTR